jgi:ABC-type oligopeptide transport system substrate-binding subunit
MKTKKLFVVAIAVMLVVTAWFLVACGSKSDDSYINNSSNTSPTAQPQNQNTLGINEYAKSVKGPLGDYIKEIYPELVPVDAPSERVHAGMPDHLVRIFKAEGETYWESMEGNLYTVPVDWPGGEPPLGKDGSICYWDDPKTGGMYVFGYWF